MDKLMPQVKLEPYKDQLESMKYDWTNPVTNEQSSINAWDACQNIVASQGKNKGRLRASKPKAERKVIIRNRYGYSREYYDQSLLESATQQIWRYLAFAVSPHGQHQCLPMGADFDTPFDMSVDESRRFAKWCDEVTDVIRHQYSAKEQPGLMRWGRAIYGDHSVFGYAAPEIDE